MLECIAVNGEPVGMELDSAVQSNAVTLYAANAQDEAVLAACAAQVRVLYQNTWESIIKIGATLAQAKERCAYGTWGAWVANECNFTKKTAARYIEEYERFRDNPHVRALSPSHGVALLGVPDEATVNELAIQAKEEGWSSRELQKEITRRKQAEKEAKEAAQELERAVAAAQEIEDNLEREKAELNEKVRAANERSDAYAENLTDANEEMQRLRMELAAARRAEAEPRIVEKYAEVYPLDYDAAKEETAQLKEKSIAQEKQIEQLRAELEAAKAAAEKAPSEKEDVSPSPVGETAHQGEAMKKGPAQVITAAQFGEMITAFLDRIADVARQQFDFMPASMAGEYLDQMARVERFCADLRGVIEG